MTLVEFAGMVPVDEVQGCSFPVVGVPDEFVLTVWYWQVQLLTSVLEEPVTVAASVTDCETITVPAAGLTRTLTTFVLLLPPQPQRARNAKAPRLNKNPA